MQRLQAPLRGAAIVQRTDAEEMPQVQEEQAATPDRPGGGDHLQGRRVLSDRLSQRVLQERRQGGTARTDDRKNRHGRDKGCFRYKGYRRKQAQNFRAGQGEKGQVSSEVI